MRHTTKIQFRYPKRLKDGTWAKVTFWLEARAAASAERMRNEFKRRYGMDFLVTDGGRTNAQQVALRKAKPTLAAKPGSSWHEAGLALDIDMGHVNAATGSQAQSEAFMAEFGWHRSCFETWHFEYHVDYARSRGVKGAIAYIGNS